MCLFCSVLTAGVGGFSPTKQMRKLRLSKLSPSLILRVEPSLKPGTFPMAHVLMGLP